MLSLGCNVESCFVRTSIRVCAFCTAIVHRFYVFVQVYGGTLSCHFFIVWGRGDCGRAQQGGPVSSELRGRVFCVQEAGG